MGKTNALSGIWRTVTKSSLASGEVTLERVLCSASLPGDKVALFPPKP